MPDSKKKNHCVDEKELWIRFKKTNSYLLMIKLQVLSSSEERVKIKEAINACFEDFKKKEEVIRKLKEKK